MKKAIFAAAIAAVFVSCATTAQMESNQANLEDAIRRAAEDLSAEVGRGGRVAVIAMGSDSERLSGFLVSEMIHALVRLQGRHGFSVMDRAQLDLLLAQLEFDMSEFVDDDTAQSIGHFLGVQFIVAGEFEAIGPLFRFRARVIEVQTAAIRGSYAANVRNDEIIAALRADDAVGVAATAPIAPIAPVAQIVPAVPITPVAQVTPARQPLERDVVPHGMARVQGGTFRMGFCPSGQHVTPVRDVTVTTFYMDVNVVTQREWRELMGTTVRQQRETERVDRLARGLAEPPHVAGEGDNLPMYFVSWYEAAEFANRRSLRSGLTPAYAISGTGANRTVTWNRGANGYRLPTEAEWEFAARGGIVCRGNFTFSGSNVVGEVAWHEGNSGGRAQPVGTPRSNALGLYGLSGNVWEWVWDKYGSYPNIAQINPVGALSGSARMARGGGWNNSPTHLRSVFRFYFDPSLRVRNFGFRLVRPQ